MLDMKDGHGEVFFCNCFYRIRLNTRKWFILTYNRMFEIIKVATIRQFWSWWSDAI